MAGATSNSSRKNQRDKGERKSAKPIKKEMTYNIIHKIMAHPNLEVVQHIKKVIKGLKINKELAGPPTSIECLICAISKLTQVISKHSNSKDIVRMSPRESWS